MGIKLNRKYLFIITAISLLWNQQTGQIEQKLAIEKAYHDKIVSAVSPILVRGKFYIIVNVEFSTVGGPLDKTGSLQSGEGASDDPFHTMGLLTRPSTQSPPSAGDPRLKKLSKQDYDIGRVEVTIGLDEASIGETESIKQKIKYLVEKLIPLTMDCDDCIKIEAYAEAWVDTLPISAVYAFAKRYHHHLLTRMFMEDRNAFDTFIKNGAP